MDIFAVMNVAQKNHITQQAAILKALGHPSRLLMVQALADGPLCVCELTALVGSEISTVSRHLAQLKHAGVLSDRREGTKIFYRLRAPCVLRFLNCIDSVIDGDDEQRELSCR
ncbi:MAG: ArsR/SmtB family transcription factor [Planctomycetota bacterium]